MKQYAKDMAGFGAEVTGYGLYKAGDFLAKITSIPAKASWAVLFSYAVPAFNTAFFNNEFISGLHLNNHPIWLDIAAGSLAGLNTIAGTTSRLIYKGFEKSRRKRTGKTLWPQIISFDTTGYIIYNSAMPEIKHTNLAKLSPRIVYTHYAVIKDGIVYGLEEDLDELIRLLPRIARDPRYHIRTLNPGEPFYDEAGNLRHHGVDDNTHGNARRPRTP